MDPAAEAVAAAQNRGPLILASVWALVPIALVFLLLRIYCKLKDGRKLWFDDYALIFSWVCEPYNACSVSHEANPAQVTLMIAGALASMAVSLGLGRHMRFIPTENITKMAPIGLIMTTFIQIGAIWSKVSFALTLLRITEGFMRIVVWGAIACINIFMGLNAVFSWVGCGKATERLNIQNCINADVVLDYGVFAACFSGVMDIILAMLPWKLLWGLQMQLKEKIGVALAMSMGVL